MNVDYFMIKDHFSTLGITLPTELTTAESHQQIAEANLRKLSSESIESSLDPILLTKDDWIEHVREAALNRAMSKELRNVAQKAFSSLDAMLSTAFRRANEELFGLLEEWFANNLETLATEYSVSAGKAEEIATLRIAFTRAHVVLMNGGIHSEPSMVGQWHVYFMFSVQAWHRLIDATRPGYELYNGQNYFKTALDSGATPHLARNWAEVERNAMALQRQIYEPHNMTMQDKLYMKHVVAASRESANR